MFGRLTSAKVNLPVKLTCVGLVGSSVVDECASEQNLTGEVWSVSAGNDRLIFKQQFPLDFITDCGKHAAPPQARSGI